MGTAVREIQGLEVEFAAPQGDHSGGLKLSRRLIAITIGLFGGVCCALVLSFLLSHPVAAAPPPLFSNPAPSVSPPAQGVLTVAQSTLLDVSSSSAPGNAAAAPITNAVSATMAPLVSALHGTVDSKGTQPVQALRQTLIPIIQPAVTSVTTAVTPVVTTLPPVLSQMVQSGLPFVLPSPSFMATAGRATSHATGPNTSAERSFASILSPKAPVRRPAPFAPTPQAPIAPTTSSVTEGSSPFSGGNPLVGDRPLDLLFPAILSIGLILWLGRDSGVLLDLRHSPPG